MKVASSPFYKHENQIIYVTDLVVRANDDSQISQSNLKITVGKQREEKLRKDLNIGQFVFGQSEYFIAC